MKIKIFITGSSGFIGFHTAKKFLDKGYAVRGFDSMNNYYDVKLKKARLNILKKYKKFSFTKGKLENKKILNKSILNFKPNVIIHLAAQAGVRYSIENPEVYLNSNIIGTFNIIEISKRIKNKHLIIGSSSSVYGANKKMPFKEIDKTDHQISFYAATKKSTENLAHTYSTLWKLPITVLRFFTVYGPWGRPDMAPMIFTKAILSGEPISIFNNGEMSRDFTYVEDIINCILKLINKPATKNESYDFKNQDSSSSWCPHQIFNLGNNNIVNLMDFIEILESELGKKAIKKFEPMQPGDVKETYADTSKIFKYIGFKPYTDIKDGIKKFTTWYKNYYLN